MDPQTVLCDMCTEEDRKPAKKTCMKCEISMCVQHLQAHLTTPVLLQTHPLTEPMALCGNTKCPQHGKLLEYYCLDDMTCVCASCATENQHRLHNMKTFSTAHKELLEKLKAEQQILQEKTDDEDVSLEKWEKSEREKLDCCSDHLIEAVTNLRDVSLTSVQSSVSARMEFFKTSKSSIEAAQKEKDIFRFLQMYSQVHQDVEKAKHVDLRKGLEPGSDHDKVVQKIRQNGEKMVMQASQFWGSLLTLVDPENHQELIPTRADLIFDPQILDSGMTLSKDKRKVFYHSWLGKCCATLPICSTKKVCQYQRWMVSLPKKSDWTIGLCDTPSANYRRNGYMYGLCCEGNLLSSLTIEPDDSSQSSTSLRLKMQYTGINAVVVEFRTTSTLLKYQGKNGDEPVPRPEKVEVLWNPDASTLSFFSRTGPLQREEITTIKVNKRNLFPFVQVGKENLQYHCQQQWRCSCGNAYYWDGNHYKINGNQYRLNTGFDNIQSGYCSCGKVLGGSHITEMVCELY